MHVLFENARQPRLNKSLNYDGEVFLLSTLRRVVDIFFSLVFATFLQLLVLRSVSCRHLGFPTARF